MEFPEIFDLQLFAEGEGSPSGEEGTGVTSQDAAESDRERLAALGVPRSKIRKNVAYSLPHRQEDEPAPAEEEAQPAPAEEMPKRMTWDEIRKDPEYSREINAMIRKRMKDAGDNKERLSKIDPLLQLIGSRYEIDPSDIDGLVNAYKTDASNFSRQADAMGIDNSLAQRITLAEADAAAMKRREAAAQREREARDHLQKLIDQGEELKKTFPGFDIWKEMEDPKFVRMTSPGSGLSVADAYYAIHRSEIQAAAAQVTAQNVSKKLSQAIQSGKARPVENGTSANASTAPSTIVMNKERRDEIKRKMREAQRQGKKYYPGM